MGMGIPITMHTSNSNTLMEDHSSAHLGAERTLAQLQQAFYWLSMRKDVNTWYKERLDCAESKGPHGELRKGVRRCTPLSGSNRYT